MPLPRSLRLQTSVGKYTRNALGGDTGLALSSLLTRSLRASRQVRPVSPKRSAAGGHAHRPVPCRLAPRMFPVQPLSTHPSIENPGLCGQDEVRPFLDDGEDAFSYGEDEGYGWNPRLDSRAA